MIIFLSGKVAADGTPVSTYFRSIYCRHEFVAAVKYNKRVVVVLEINQSKGGVPLSVHLDEAEKHTGQEGMPEVVNVLRQHAERGWIVPWHRIRAFQDVSLKLILAPIVCQESGEVDKPATRKGSEVYIPADVTRRPLKPLPPHCHLYVSRHNPGAAAVAKLLSGELKGAAKGGNETQSLSWTQDEQHSAGRFLLLLNGSTWDPAANQHADQLFRCAAPLACSAARSRVAILQRLYK